MSVFTITHTQCVKDRVKEHAWRLARACKCGAPIPYETHANRRDCDYCRATRSARNKSVAKASGMCHWCLKTPAVLGKYCSQEHLKAHRERMAKSDKNVRERRKASGLCTQCGKAPPDNGNVRCAPCHIRYSPANTYVKKSKSLFVCACGKQEMTHMATTKKRCKACANAHAKKNSKKHLRRKEDDAIEAGKCATCMKRQTDGTRECTICSTRRKLRTLERKERMAA